MCCSWFGAIPRLWCPGHAGCHRCQRQACGPPMPLESGSLVPHVVSSSLARCYRFLPHTPPVGVAVMGRAMRRGLQLLPSLRKGTVVPSGGQHDGLGICREPGGGGSFLPVFRRGQSSVSLGEEEGNYPCALICARLLRCRAAALSRKSLGVQSEWVLNPWV